MDVKSREIVPLILVLLKSYKDTRKMNEKTIKTPNLCISMKLKTG